MENTVALFAGLVLGLALLGRDGTQSFATLFCKRMFDARPHTAVSMPAKQVQKNAITTMRLNTLPVLAFHFCTLSTYTSLIVLVSAQQHIF